MPTALCFRCKENYTSHNEDDLEGDGKCPKCKALSQRIAFDIDIKMGEIRKHRGVEVTPLQRLQKALQEGGAIKARDLNLPSLQ